MFKTDDYLKIMAVNGDYRHGYISEVRDHGMEITVSFYEEGASKIGYDEAMDKLTGYPPRDWERFLTETEKKLIPLIAQQMTTTGIAADLKLSPSTIRSEIRTLRIKLQLEDRVQLIHYCQGLRRKLQNLEPAQV